MPPDIPLENQLVALTRRNWGAQLGSDGTTSIRRYQRRTSLCVRTGAAAAGTGTAIGSRVEGAEVEVVGM